MKNTTFYREIMEARRAPGQGLVSPWQGRQNPIYGAATLREYRLNYPRSAPVPTITQSGLIGPLLERQHRKYVRSLRRRAACERILAGAVKAAIWVWKTLGPRPAHQDMEPLTGAVPNRI